jgi:hypothetical protein
VGAAFPPGRKPYGLAAAASKNDRGWKAAPTKFNPLIFTDNRKNNNHL